MSLADISSGAPAAAPVPAASPAPADAPAANEGQVTATAEAETAASTTPKTEAKPDKQTSRIASLSRENREISKRLKEAEAKASRFDEVSTKAKADPKAIVETFGLTFEQLVDAFAGTGDLPKDPQAEIVARLDAIEAEKKAADDAKAKDETEAAEKAHGVAVSTAVSETKKTIASDPVRWELIAKVEDAPQIAFDSVFTVITSNPEKDFTPAELNGLLAEALDALENHYEEEGKRFQKRGTAAAATNQPAASQSQSSARLTLAEISAMPRKSATTPQLQTQKPKTLSDLFR